MTDNTNTPVTTLEGDLSAKAEVLIDQHLPSLVGKHLKARLATLDKLEARILELSQVVTDKNEQLNELHGRVKTVQELATLNEQYQEREAKFQKFIAEQNERERLIDLTILKIRLEAEQSKTKHATDVALGLVKNTMFKRSVFESREELDPNYHGQTKHLSHSTDTKETTTNDDDSVA